MSEQHNVLLSRFLLLVVHEDHGCPVIWGWGMVFEVSDSPATWYPSLQDVPLMLLGRHGWLGVDDALLCCRCLLGGPMTLQANPQSSTPTMASRALFSESGGGGGGLLRALLPVQCRTQPKSNARAHAAWDGGKAFTSHELPTTHALK